MADPLEPAQPRSEGLVLLGEIAAEIAHELRNTLQLVTNDVFLAQQNPEAAPAHLERIGRSARKAQSIVDDVLALARGLPNAVELVSLAEVLAAARDGLPESVTFDDTGVPHGFPVRAHPGLLARLFHVLYENAVHAAAPKPAHVRTRAERDGVRAVVVVEDDGPGVPEAIAERVFDPLVTARAGGTGLGLALARRVAEAHGGTLVLASRVPASFRLTLEGT